jgi:DNA-binding MarR family transcriptional regulator
MASLREHQLSREELGAWRGFLRVHSKLVADLDRELELAHGLPLRAYEVLLHLETAGEQRLRMAELAGSVLLSQSGLTRLVDRLERDGLVQRVPCAEDRRGQWAVLTDAGLQALHDARPTHLAGVRRLFLEPLDAGDLRALARCWNEIEPGSAV